MQRILWVIVLVVLMIPFVVVLTFLFISCLNVIIKGFRKDMGWKEWLITQVAGKMLMITGIGGAILNPFYDYIVQRPVIEFGGWQWLVEIWLLVCAYVGWLLADFTSDL